MCVRQPSLSSVGPRSHPFAARLSLLAFAGALTGVVACGGDAPKPNMPGGAGAAEAGAESFSEVNPADLAELDAGAKANDAGASAVAASGDGGGAASPVASVVPAQPDAKDECTPVGVDFEKRARPQLKACYAEGKKKDANLQGTVKITVDIDTLGKIKSIKIIEKTLPDPVAQCMLKVVKATPLPDAAKCPGKALTIPVTFPTPH